MPNRLREGRLPGGIPIPVVALGLPLAGILFVLVATRFGAPAARSAAVPVRVADITMQDRPDGSVIVRQAGDGRVVDTVQPATGAFLRVMLAGLVRERRREGEGAPSVPFHLTGWSDGRLTIDDLATHKLIELNAFGPANAGAFARLLDLSRPQPAAPPP